MFLISNHILVSHPEITLPEDTVIRINCAWVNDMYELGCIIKGCNYPVFLDFPTGRLKPPIPKLALKDVLNLANQYKNVKYFSYSNASNINEAIDIKTKLTYDMVIVPKIEDIKGAMNLLNLADTLHTKMIMIDKEDLFTNCTDTELYLFTLKYIREICKQHRITVLELYGVIFSHD